MSKTKKPAIAVYVCQSKEEAQNAIKALGDAQRELTRLQTEINDRIAEIVSGRKDEMDALAERVETLTNGIHIWCEVNRVGLCGDKGKSANLITGEVAWRTRPPSVSIRSADKVVETLRKLSLSRFLREKVEVDKNAILAEPAAVAGIVGITIVSGVEDFSVTPFELEVAP